MISASYNHSIDLWIEALTEYSFIQLCISPSPEQWSLGQLYIHLINDTQFYLDQMQVCVSNNENINEVPSEAAKKMFLANEFPDIQIEGAPGNATIPQPNNKEVLLNNLLRLKIALQSIEKTILLSLNKGKTRHPGLGYFTAAEWLQFADMHFRHHLLQKKRIDDFIFNNFLP